MPTGRVRWFDAAKGYGFITSEEGKDVFLPAQALPTGVTTLRKGGKVEYSVVDGRRGPQAMDVRLIASAPSLVKAPARRRMTWPPSARTSSRCLMRPAIRCAVTVTHLLPTAKSWPRCCVRWRINSMYRTDLIYD